MSLLRLATAGSVDDGKSTLVGRLLYDSKSVLTDQLEAVQRVSRERGLDGADLALLTDGLRAEREQGITIDVAYRYFATAGRKFILADTPGHVEYTRNMVTGASTAELAVILVDARKGVLEQTRRHAAVAALLRVPHVVLAVNKMDLVDWDESVFEVLAKEFTAYAEGLGVPDVTPIPVSALRGDNLVDRSTAMPWYDGPTLLEHLESVPTAFDAPGRPMRFPVQYVLRPQTAEHPDYRGYAGRLASGVLEVGDEVVVLPGGRRTRVAGIDTFDGPLTRAFAPMSVAVRLADDLDVSRGDLLAAADAAPVVTQDLTATVCWLGERPLRRGDRVLVRSGTRLVKGLVRELVSRLDLATLEHAGEVRELVANDIGLVQVRTAEPLPLDAYADNRGTGSFLLIDEHDGATVAAGMVGPPPGGARA